MAKAPRADGKERQHSAVDLRHLPFAVARPRRRRQRRLELRQVGGGEHQVRRGDVLLEVLAALGSRNGHDVFAPPQQPRQRDLSRRRALPLRHLLHRGSDAHVRIEVRALEPRVVPAQVALREPPGALDGPAEEAASERSERDEHDAELTQQRDDPRLEVPFPERVLALERRDRMHLVRAPDGLLARLGQAEVTDLSPPNEIGHRAHHVLDRHLLVDAVLVEEVDVIGLEPARGGFHHLADVLRAAIEANDLPIVEPEAELGGDDHLIALALESASEKLLVVPDAVGLGGVEERHPQLDGALDGSDRFRIVAGAVRLAHPHATEAQLRDLESLLSELPFLQHDVPSSPAPTTNSVAGDQHQETYGNAWSVQKIFTTANRVGDGGARYCCSLTFAIKSMTFPFRFSLMAR